MDFQLKTKDATIKEAIQGELVNLYSLHKTEQEVYEDCRRGLKCIEDWLSTMFKSDKNRHGL